MEAINIRLTKPQQKKIKEIQGETGENRSEVIRRLLDKALN